MDSYPYPYLLLAIEHHYVSTKDCAKRAGLYEESWAVRRELAYGLLMEA